jgi:hypothetical protein
MGRSVKGQAMTEFIFMSFVAFIILFVAIQMAALGREYMALGQLNYQVARWATDPGNNSLKDSSGNAVNSPQCSDVANIIAGQRFAVQGVSAGFDTWERLIQQYVWAPSRGGIGVAGNCVARHYNLTLAVQRPAGTGSTDNVDDGYESGIFWHLQPAIRISSIPFQLVQYTQC